MKKYALLFLIVLAFMAGGCGGGGEDLSGDLPAEDTNTPQVSAALDSNGDRVPDVFGYYDSSSGGGRTLLGDGSAYDVPYLNYIASSDTEQDGSFTANIYLLQGSEYVMKYSHSSRTLGENDLDFTILAPDGETLAFDFGFEAHSGEDAPAEMAAEESKATASDDALGILSEDEAPHDYEADTPQEFITVKASIDILPPENPCMIFYTFTAPQTGSYTFIFREKEYAPVSNDVPYEVRIYRSDDDSALKLGSITMTPREMLNVQRVLVNNATDFNKDGLPVKFTPEFVSEDVYQNLIQKIADDHALTETVRASAETGTYIKPIVYYVPYDKEFSAGRGFNAASGLAARSESAFETFVMPTPKTGAAIPVDTHFKMNVIVTEEEHTTEQELEAMSTFALAKNALGMRIATSTNVRLAQISKTIIITYEVIEHDPRLVDVRNIKLLPDALEILSEDTNEFREEFGDYFVAGYTWGLWFKAVISVTADNSSVLDKVCGQIQTIGTYAQGGQNYASEIADLEQIAKKNYLNIEVDELIIDGGDPRKSNISTVSAIKSVADALTAFSAGIQDTTKDDYV